MEITATRLQDLCAKFQQQSILVIGDLMLDHLVIGEARRISPEAPIPVVNFSHETFSPGGAANVACNLAALGATVELLGVVGDDAPADHMRDTLGRHGLSPAGLVVEPGRPTTTKMRITAQRHQIVRLDRETCQPITATSTDQLLGACTSAIPRASAIIIADYAKGVVEQPLLDAVLPLARERALPVCVDPKPAHRLNLSGCALLTPNRREAFELAGIRDSGPTGAPASDPALLEAIGRIQERYNPTRLLITLSEAGLLLVERGQTPRHVPTVARQVYDVTGAGDTVIASFVLAQLAGATPIEAAIVANHAAGIVVGKTGTAAVTPRELIEWVGTSRPGGDAR